MSSQQHWIRSVEVEASVKCNFFSANTFRKRWLVLLLLLPWGFITRNIMLPIRQKFIRDKTLTWFLELCQCEFGRLLWIAPDKTSSIYFQMQMCCDKHCEEKCACLCSRVFTFCLTRSSLTISWGKIAWMVLLLSWFIRQQEVPYSLMII